MDFRCSEFRRTATDLKEAARRGEWKRARGLAERLESFGLMDIARTSPDDLSNYLRALEETLLAVKTSRALMLATLRRVRAAAVFQSARILPL